MLDPLTHKHEDYNYAFLRRMIENIKQTKDAQCPEEESANKVMLINKIVADAKMSNEKIMLTF